MKFDMRDFLCPRRLTIAMWDTAYMVRRNGTDPFRDWDQCLADARERGFNTIRIDAFPGIINPKDLDEVHTWPDQHTPYQPWMWNHAYTGTPGRNLIEFINLAARHGLHVTLSSWWSDSRYIPESAEQAAHMWCELLAVLKRECGFDAILFTDLCNEIPGFLPGYEKQLLELKSYAASQEERAYLAPTAASGWNAAQLSFLKESLDSSLKIAQEAFPEMRFTYSMNINEDFQKVGFQNLDVLDIHFFLSDSRFSNRTKFNEYIRDAYVSDANYADFSDRARRTVQSVGPMLRQKQRRQLAWGKQFSDALGAPLVTTEAWASWFYLDHPALHWDWLLEWCELLVQDAAEFGLWGITTNNYAEPYFQLWKDVRWHQRINEAFLKS